MYRCGTRAVGTAVCCSDAPVGPYENVWRRKDGELTGFRVLFRGLAAWFNGCRLIGACSPAAIVWVAAVMAVHVRADVAL